MILLFAAPPLAGLLSLLLYIVVLLIVAGLLFWAVNRLSAAFGIPEPNQDGDHRCAVALVIVIVIALLYFLLGAGSLRM